MSCGIYIFWEVRHSTKFHQNNVQRRHTPPNRFSDIPDNKVHGPNTGPTWVLYVGPMNLAVRDITHILAMIYRQIIHYEVGWGLALIGVDTCPLSKHSAGKLTTQPKPRPDMPHPACTPSVSKWSTERQSIKYKHEQCQNIHIVNIYQYHNHKPTVDKLPAFTRLIYSQASRYSRWSLVMGL